MKLNDMDLIVNYIQVRVIRISASNFYNINIEKFPRKELKPLGIHAWYFKYFRYLTEMEPQQILPRLQIGIRNYK